MKRFAVAIAALSIAALIGLRTERASASAFDLHFTENCYGWGADVKLKWTGQVPNATQYVDYTRVNNNFAAGTFLSSGPLGGTAETFTATHLTPNVPYLVRVNQLNNGTWSASETWVIQPCSSLDVQKTSLMNSDSPNKPNTYCGINCAMAWNNLPTPPFNAPTNQNFIPYEGNGGGPTLCRDGMTSRSSGSGTCSDHGGIAQ